MTTSTLKPRKSGYLPSLDGWRAIAIIGVLATHDLPFVIFGHSSLRAKNLGGLGVELFFAISGFLITTRILEEERLCGYFNIKRFYIRRLFRIQPAAWAYLAVIALLIACGTIPETWYHWFAALFLFQNFTFHGFADISDSFFTGHFWTLAVEEHFYILLSLTLLLFKKYRVWILGALYVGFQVLAHVIRVKQIYSLQLYPRRTDAQIHFLLLAAIVAVLMQRREVLRAVEVVLHPWVVFLGTAIFLTVAVDRSQTHPWLPAIHQATFLPRMSQVATYGFILWIVSTMFHPQSLTTRLLETSVFRFFGRISYSLYLWHILFFFRIEGSVLEHITNPILLALSGRPIKQVMAVVVAVASYYWIEKPMIRLGHRLAPAATPGRPELADLPIEKPAVQSADPATP